MPFELVNPKINEPTLFKTKSFTDERGYFFEAYKSSDIKHLGLNDEFVQDNVSFSVKDVLRGLHYQLNPMAQAKYVACLKGHIFDVVVDIRKGSPNYGKCYYNNLSDQNMYILYVPEGFAHGFIVKSNDALVLYKTNKEYSPKHEAGIIWNDPVLNINWGVATPIVADKDKKLPTFRDTDNNFTYNATDPK